MSFFSAAVMPPVALDLVRMILVTLSILLLILWPQHLGENGDVSLGFDSGAEAASTPCVRSYSFDLCNIIQPALTAKLTVPADGINLVFI